MMTAAGELSSALQNRRESLAIFTRLAEADPKNVLAQRSLAVSHMHLAELFDSAEGSSLGQPAEAIAHYERAAEILNQHGDAGDTLTRANLQRIGERLPQLRAKRAGHP